MSLIVSLIGLLMVVMGLTVIVNPRFFRRLLKDLVTRRWIYPAAALRVVIGARFISRSANLSDAFLRLEAIVALLLGAALIWAGPELPIFTP